MKGKFKWFISGSIAGIVSRTITAPFERIKLQEQMEEQQRKRKRKGVLRRLLEIGKEEGIGGLFKGNLISCVKVIPASGIRFLSQEMNKRCFLQVTKQKKLTTGQKLFVGAMSGTISIVLTHPLEILRTRLTLGSGSDFESGNDVGVLRKWIDEMKRVVSVGIFVGIVPAILGTAPFQAINFATYELLEEAARTTEIVQEYLKSQPKLKAMLPSIFGVISGAVAMGTLYPLDVIKRKMMIVKHGKHQQVGMKKTIERIFDQDGMKGFYHGMWPAFFKVVPTVSINWFTFELCKKVLVIH